MENFISKKLLAQIKSLNSLESARNFSEAKSLNQKGNSGYSDVSVFLSHKHGQDEILEEVVTLLRKLEVQVYIDWQDYGIPKFTDGSTALRIKTKIKENNKFILLATEEAVESKWCNWELGLGDAFKFPDNIAIMPITDNDNSEFSGSEYLQTYPVITSEYYTIPGHYYVEYNALKISLKTWLSN